MANWNEILNEIKKAGSTHDVVRRKYLNQLHEITGRNIISYYSGWLQKPDISGVELNDEDKNGFMNAIHGMDTDIGLDLILHTPGGETAATESLVDYLRSMFGTNIRAIIPQLALSAGTMVSCAASEIIMGKHSSLGPIDPQFKGLPAHGVIEEFDRAYNEIRHAKSKTHLWQVIISKYHPTLIGECEKAIEWSEEMVKDWLLSGMLSDIDDPETVADKIIEELGDHALTKSHARHISIDKCREIGLNVSNLEDNPDLQDAVLSVHHSYIQTLSHTDAYKIIENHEGIAYVKLMRIIKKN